MSERQRRARNSRRAAHRRSAGAVVSGGLVVVGSLVTGAVAQAGPSGAHVEVFSDSGAAAAANAGTHNYGDGSAKETLADAITFLNSHGGGTITFSSKLSGDTIELSQNLPLITASMTVAGLGAGKLKVDGGNAYELLDTTDAAALTISGLTLERGLGSDIVSDYGGNLTVTDSVIEGSVFGVRVEPFVAKASKVKLSGDTIRAARLEGVYVENASALTISRSLLEDNNCGLYANGGPVKITGSSIVDNHIGGDSGYGGVRDRGYNGTDPVTIVNSTISGNAVIGDAPVTFVGGGISLGRGIDLDLVGDTITDNEVENTDTDPDSDAIGGGIAMGFSGRGPTGTAVKLTLEDSVVAGNRVETAVAGDASYPDVAIASGVKSVVKDSLIGAGKSAADTFTKLTFSAHDQEGTTAEPLNPKLGKLKPAGSKKATAGGALEVQKPEQGSPLIGKGAAKPFSSKATPFTTDELGTKRPSKGVTIGAYQVPAPKQHKRKKKQFKGKVF